MAGRRWSQIVRGRGVGWGGCWRRCSHQKRLSSVWGHWEMSFPVRCLFPFHKVWLAAKLVTTVSAHSGGYTDTVAQAGRPVSLKPAGSTGTTETDVHHHPPHSVFPHYSCYHWRRIHSVWFNSRVWVSQLWSEFKLKQSVSHYQTFKSFNQPLWHWSQSCH